MRHKNDWRSKGVDGEPCLDKEILEVDVDKQGKERKIRGGSSAATPVYNETDARDDEESQSPDNLFGSKRPSHPPYDFQTQMVEAVRSITDALTANSPLCPPDAALISSIQLQLHQVFLFAVTLSSRDGPEMTQMREISGLIQILGILSGIQICAGTSAHPKDPPMSYDSNTPGAAPRQNDIGTV